MVGWYVKYLSAAPVATSVVMDEPEEAPVEHDMVAEKVGVGFLLGVHIFPRSTSGSRSLYEVY